MRERSDEFASVRWRSDFARGYAVFALAVFGRVEPERTPSVTIVTTPAPETGRAIDRRRRP
jgi:hypothetical protein